MFRKNLLFIFILLLFIFFQFIPLKAKGEQIRIFADTLEFDLKSEHLQGKGNIKVYYGQIFFQADEFHFAVPQKSLRAGGDVFLSDGNQYEIKSDSLHFNTESKLWSIENGQFFILPSYHFFCEKAEQLSENKFFISKACYSACELEEPDWKICSSGGTVQLGQSIKLRNVSFKVKNKPIFLFPYFSFPINQDRAAGFLIPDFGHSDNYGTFIENYFYWPIRSWIDLGFPVDFYEKRGSGGGLELRYALSKKDSGNLRIYGIYDKEERKKRGDISLQLQQNVPSNIRAVVDSVLVSDDGYNRDFHQQLFKRYSNFFESKAFVEKFSDNWSIRLLTEHIETISQKKNPRFFKAPQIDFYSRINPWLKLPVFFQLHSSWVSFQTEDTTNPKLNSTVDQGALSFLQTEERTKQTGQRITLCPTVYYNYTNRFFTVTPSFSYMGFYYSLENDTDNSMRENKYSGEIDFTGPKFQKFFPSIHHLWYPQISYLYETLDGDDTIEVGLDSFDQLSEDRKIAFSLVNHLWSRQDSFIDEADLHLRQMYYFQKNISGEEEENNLGFENFQIEANTLFRKGTKGTLLLTYDTNEGEIKEADIGYTGVTSARYYWNIGWRYSRVYSLEDNQIGYEDINTLKGNLQIPFLSNWVGEIKVNYDFKNEFVIENQYILTYKGSCWSTQMSYIDNLDEQRWGVRINLDTLGGFGL